MRNVMGLFALMFACHGLALGEPGAYRHVVIFQFKDGTPAEKVREIEAAFAALPKKIEAIRSFEWGTNVSPEGLNPALTHCFVLTFESKEAIERGYLHHPAHDAFVSLIKPILEKAVVVDYVAQAPGK
ncbi:MAG: Dabb family protein [Verrucomicrobiae bacterium]|nr:Dabb family protein [Verrucomicrobiae bacterium]